MSFSDNAPSCAARSEQPISAEVVERNSPFRAPTVRDAISRHLILLGCAAAVIFAAFFLQVQGEHAVCLPLIGTPLPELCYWRAISGLPCPGCGLTRCFISMAHGEWSRAWSFQPVGCLLFLGVLFQFPYRSWQIWRLRRGDGDRAPRWLVVTAWLFIPALFVQWIWRLLP